MPQLHELSRRAFLRRTGMTAVLGAVGAKPSLTGAQGLPASISRQTFDFDEIYDRRDSESIKWDRPIEGVEAEIEVGMGIADMDFRAAPCITDALARRCEHENWGYLERPDSFTQAIVDWNQRRYGLEIDPGSIELTSGVHSGLIAALRTFSPPGSSVLMNTPTYDGFYNFELRYSRTVAEDSEMQIVDGRYQVDWDDFERRAGRANVFILCNPQNPTGNCWSEEDLLRMGEICLRHRVIVLADEVHCDFVTAGNRYTPFASLPDQEIVNNSLTFKGASKSFSLAAMKAAWYFSTNPDLLARVRSNTRVDLSTLGMEANRAALIEGDDWLDQLLPYIDANHDFAERYLRENIPMIKFTKPQGTYLAWLDVSELAERIGARELAEEENRTSETTVTPEQIMQRWFGSNARIYLNPGSAYGTGGAGHMRMNLATSRLLIRRALDNIAAAVAMV
ncbi:MAG: aminotransferase class I/II-fold pyridoxal phosphate-dependent enzyme [Rhodospirillaceae bacterium]|nr:aminotransferase class I/II-fold pyridoxal phosphate-dependent enzyme [Rhodospirillaceae bacterium]